LFLALFISYTLAQTSPICQVDSDCNTYLTYDSMRCDTTKTPAACVARTLFDYKANVTGPGQCSKSLNINPFGSVPKCGAYSTLGCSVTDTYTVCANSQLNPTTQVCEKIPDVNATFVGEGQRCTSTNPPVLCNNNLVCIQQVCRKVLALGDNCYVDRLGCANGLVCDSGVCVLQLSKQPQEPCSDSSACASTACLNGRCLEYRSRPCYSNTDCTGYASVCYVAPGQLLGRCTSSFPKTLGAFYKCAYDKCSSTSIRSFSECIQGANTCVPQIIDYYCESMCQTREDNRFDSGSGFGGYTYDCTARTRTLLPSNTCNYKAAILNCPSFPLSGAFTQGISFLAIIAILIFFS